MKSKIARYFLIAAGVMGAAGAPALFAGDMDHDFRHLARENADIRADRFRVHEDLEHGRFWQAQRDRADLNRDYYNRSRQVRDIRRDEFRRDWR